MAITVAAYPTAGNDLGPLRRGQFVGEIIAVTGATGIAGDQAAAYRLRHVHKNAWIDGGACVIASNTTDIAGESIVIEARVALANTTAYITVWGDE